MRSELSARDARRAAIAAQGLAARRPAVPIQPRHIRKTLDRIGVLQIDSVNVLVRSHYMPLFSRLGAYPVDMLDRYAYQRHRLFEGWGHVATLMPVEHYRLLGPRMESFVAEGLTAELIASGYMEAVYQEVKERGPLTGGELTDPGGRTGPWWGYSQGKYALEWLFLTGRLAATRKPNFTRVYDLAERVIPAAILDQPVPTTEEADRQLLLMAARACGVATSADLADYYRIGTARARPRLRELVESGHLMQTSVRGWDDPAYVVPDVIVPRAVKARALLSPFDSLVWSRPRVERLFGFRYRIEIYVPEPQRVYGYYVYPFLLGDALVARVDLKADRKNRTLLVQAAHIEPGRDPIEVAAELATELHELAAWLDLASVVVKPRGDLAAALGRSLG